MVILAVMFSAAKNLSHNLKVIGSNPIPATKFDAKNPAVPGIAGFLIL